MKHKRKDIMTKEEIKNEAIKACKDYGYDWVMANYDCEEELLKGFRKEMRVSGKSQVDIFGGEEPYYALDRVSDVDLMSVMEEGDVFNEGNVYNWITLGRIDAWKELFGRKTKKVGYFCNGYQGYVFFPERVDVDDLKRCGEVVVG